MTMGTMPVMLLWIQSNLIKLLVISMYHVKVSHWFYFDRFLKGGWHQLSEFAIHLTYMYLMDLYQLTLSADASKVGSNLYFFTSIR